MIRVTDKETALQIALRELCQKAHKKLTGKPMFRWNRKHGWTAVEGALVTVTMKKQYE